MKLRVITTLTPDTLPEGYECEAVPAKFTDGLYLVKDAKGFVRAVKLSAHRPGDFYRTINRSPHAPKPPRAILEVIQ